MLDSIAAARGQSKITAGLKKEYILLSDAANCLSRMKTAELSYKFVIILNRILMMT
jgi:hypothetical protein